ncbi:hypothetical protein CK203_061093 [Vitis vinifera]|uniref:Uncharacterized protein n=1 Tax=Vitis vinifera TaxID=29760 RepID=A0A438G9Z3_VITVI|nr:hypothetical protein CK203_061093 [Vitis vinifera]
MPFPAHQSHHRPLLLLISLCLIRSLLQERQLSITPRHSGGTISALFFNRFCHIEDNVQLGWGRVEKVSIEFKLMSSTLSYSHTVHNRWSLTYCRCLGIKIHSQKSRISEIEESSLESISKSRIQGVWDPARSTRLPPPFHPAAATSTRMYHIRKTTTGWERRAFQLPQSHISGSAYSAYPESFTTILHSAAMFS